jgi:hypothetical protein
MLVVLLGPLVFRLMREFFARQEAAGGGVEAL